MPKFMLACVHPAGPCMFNLPREQNLDKWRVFVYTSRNYSPYADTG